MIDMNCH